jgi:hypothetical protein
MAYGSWCHIFGDDFPVVEFKRGRDRDERRDFRGEIGVVPLIPDRAAEFKGPLVAEAEEEGAAGVGG